MSTNLECNFWERNPREWYYELEDPMSNSMDPDFFEYGPFPTWKAAHTHLHRNNANPGGFGIEPHPDSDDKSWDY